MPTPAKPVANAVCLAAVILTTAGAALYLGGDGDIAPRRIVAGPAPACGVMQITSTTEGFNGFPSMAGNGWHIAFEAVGLQIALHDLDQATTTVLAVIASAPGSSGQPTVDSDGKTVAFSTSADVLPPQNADESGEIYSVDAGTRAVTQLTEGSDPDFNSTDVVTSISGDGTRVVFNYDGDLTGQNGDGGFELFLYDYVSHSFSQLTSDNVLAFPVISRDGSRVAFDSTSDLTGENSEHNSEIFLLDVSNGEIAQVTHASEGDSLYPSLNRDASIIAFHSTADLTGENPDGNSEIYLLDVATNTFTQVTDTTEGGFANVGASLNAAGDRLAFVSYSNLTGGNPDGNREMFLYDTAAGTATQITDSVAGASIFTNSWASISAFGGRIAFQSSADLTGGNQDTNSEVFLAECPVSSLWGDLDCGGNADALDALRVLRQVSGLGVSVPDQSCPGLQQSVEVATGSPHTWGDVDCDGKISAVDALALLRFVAGLAANAAQGCPPIGNAAHVIA